MANTTQLDTQNGVTVNGDGTATTHLAGKLEMTLSQNLVDATGVSIENATAASMRKTPWGATRAARRVELRRISEAWTPVSGHILDLRTPNQNVVLYCKRHVTFTSWEMIM